MDNPGAIQNRDELEFAIFCIESIAQESGRSAVDVYDALTAKSNVLNEYIVPGYEILHTQGKSYIVNDVLSLLHERNVEI